MKPDSHGVYRPNIGWSTLTSQYRFCCGKDKAEAERREARIRDLWASVEERWNEYHDGRCMWSWDEAAFRFAKSLAAGVTSFPIGGKPDDQDLLVSFNAMMARYPTLSFHPVHPAAYEASVKYAAEMQGHELTRLKDAGTIPLATKRLIDASGTLHEAMKARIKVIEVDYFDKLENHVSDSGNYKVSSLISIMSYIPDMPLAELDLAALDQIIGVFRNRPVSAKTKKPLAYGTCQKRITEFNDFLMWLDTFGKTGWEIPHKYDRIKTTVKTIDTDSEETKPADVFKVKELVILNRYATPLERMFLLLGLNCAFGADQIGRLKVRELRLEHKHPHIARIRRKKGIRGHHLLWKQTIDGLRQSLAGRDLTPSDYVLLNENGLPYWRKTKGGNRARDIANRWNDLLERVQKDHPDFPALPFNTLRNTSGNFVRKIAGAELAQLQITHAHQSKDRNLRRYTNPNIKKLFRVQARLELRLSKVFDTAGPNPWKAVRHSTTPKVVDQIVALHDQGMKPNGIAAKLNISHMTVRRHLKRLEKG